MASGSMLLLLPLCAATSSVRSRRSRLGSRRMAKVNCRGAAAVQCSLGALVLEHQPHAWLQLQDIGAAAAVVTGAYLWVQGFEFLTRSNILDQKLSRKLVHITTGPLFMTCWPLFSVSPWSRYFAALVPLANGLRLLALGLGLRSNQGVVRSMSRGGDPRELLQGPLYYVVVLFISTLCFWRESPVGIMALAMMCGGDGVADIVGRRFGSWKLPHNPNKSWAGSVAMFVAGLSLSIAFIKYFSVWGFCTLDLESSTILKVAGISLAATAMESLPVTQTLDDNLIVPGTVFILGLIMFSP